MQKRTERHFSWGYLIVGALFIIAAFIAFFNPASNLHTFAVVYAVLAIIQGIWLIINRSGSAWRVIGGVFDILLGIFMLMNIYIAITALAYVFAIWFIADSVFRLASLGEVRATAGAGYFAFSLIVGILGVIVGFMLLFQPALSLLTLSFLVGFYLMMIGIALVVAAFSYSSETDVVEAYDTTNDDTTLEL